MKTTTTKDYTTTFKGYEITVPKGSTVSSSTALGPDLNYHFWVDYQATAEKLTGFKDSILRHDLEHYGLDVPADFCTPYAKEA